MFIAYRFFTGADGDSHVERGSVSALVIGAESLQFRESPAHASKDFHAAPVPQYVIILTGVVELTTRSGATCTTHPGDVLLMTDTTGSGHAWRVVGDVPWTRACVVLSSEADFQFSADARR